MAKSNDCVCVCVTGSCFDRPLLSCNQESHKRKGERNKKKRRRRRWGLGYVNTLLSCVSGSFRFRPIRKPIAIGELFLGLEFSKKNTRRTRTQTRRFPLETVTTESRQGALLLLFLLGLLLLVNFSCLLTKPNKKKPSHKIKQTHTKHSMVEVKGKQRTGRG